MAKDYYKNAAVLDGFKFVYLGNSYQFAKVVHFVTKERSQTKIESSLLQFGS